MQKPEGLFNKMSHKGVSSDSGYWIKLECVGLKENKENKKIRERGRGWCLLPVGKKNTAAPPWLACQSSPEQADGELRCTVFYSKSTGREESDASPFPAINTVGEVVSAEVHGGAMNGPSELAELGLRAAIDQTECTRRKRTARRTRRDTWRG